jgi:hypothetical protein
MLLCEHSPIRKLWVSWKWKGIASWVSVHIVRHKLGIEHFVKSQRTDRTGIDRHSLPQDALVDHECEANAQAIINISRKRLCVGEAAPETVKAWKEFLNSIKDKEPELYAVSVPECIYRGFCCRFNSCGYSKTEQYQRDLEEYRSGM